MATIKAKKGNPFERLIAYNLLQAGYNVTRIDDNTPGIDLIATINNVSYAIECKHHAKFSWMQLIKYYKKTESSAKKMNKKLVPMLILRANYQPVLVFINDLSKGYTVFEFKKFNKIWIQKIPKNHKIWTKNKE